MSDVLSTVLLLALPASGKSEVRRYLDRMPAAERRRDFHMGTTVQLDDFPYVHLMRRIDDELARVDRARLFFHAPDRPFRDPRDWGTLIELLNEDHRDVLSKKPHAPTSAALHLFERLDRASTAVGIAPRLASLEPQLKGLLADRMESDARAQLNDKLASYPDALEGKTLVVEFARGGKQGSEMPLAAPFGYAYSLSRLSDALLEKATILYVWVTPEESRRKNEARTDPNDPGSILHHGVPIDVMLNDYGIDDMAWLESESDRPGTVKVKTRNKTHYVPIARFDNRVDKTSFIREDERAWKPEDVKAVHEGLAGALTHLSRVR